MQLMRLSPGSPRSTGVPRLRYLTVLLLLAAACAPGPAPATTVSDLYTASTPVPDQSAVARAPAFSRDLVAVLVKVSGNPNAGQVAALQSAIDAANKLVVEYRYQSVPAGQGGGLALRVRFDPKAVDAALERAGQAIWGRDRPTVAVWVLAPSGIVGEDATSAIAAAMRQAAEQRGLPLVVPLMDLTDRQRVSSFDIRTLFLPALQSASKRYDAQAMLVGTIDYAGQGTVGSWTLVFGQTTAPFAITAASPQAAAAQGVEQAATQLAQQLAYQPGSGAEGVVALVVDGIDSLGAEVQVQRIAAGVQGVSAVTLVKVAAGVARFRVNYAGVPADLARALALSGSLSQTSGPVLPAPATASVGAAAGSAVPAIYFRYGK